MAFGRKKLKLSLKVIERDDSGKIVNRRRIFFSGKDATCAEATTSRLDLPADLIVTLVCKNLKPLTADSSTGSDEKKGFTEDLRKKLKLKMSKISERDLNLKQFPYAKVEKGEFFVSGVPPAIVLKTPSYLSRDQCQKLLDAEIRIFRNIERQTAIADTRADRSVPLSEPLLPNTVDVQHLPGAEIQVLHNITPALNQASHGLLSTPSASLEKQALPLQDQKDRPPGKENCAICGKTFAYKSKLARHSITHTGAKDYSCDVCGKSFSQKATLKKHIKVHSFPDA